MVAGDGVSTGGGGRRAAVVAAREGYCCRDRGGEAAHGGAAVFDAGPGPGGVNIGGRERGEQLQPAVAAVRPGAKLSVKMKRRMFRSPQWDTVGLSTVPELD